VALGGERGEGGGGGGGGERVHGAGPLDERAGRDISHGALAWHGAWAYPFRFSGWERRGRWFGYSDVIRAVKSRLMAGHDGDYFYLLSYARSPALTDADGRKQLLAVIQPVLERVRVPPAAGRFTCPWGEGGRGRGAFGFATPRARRAHPAQADSLGQPCYTEVTNPADQPFFESLGASRQGGGGWCAVRNGHAEGGGGGSVLHGCAH
jgi:hypothetical protein